MLKNQDIIIVGLQPWDIEIGSNCKNLALEFAKNNRVLYVNHPLDRNSIKHESHKPLIKKRIDLMQYKELNLFQIGENLWNFYPSNILESINFIPIPALFNFMNRRNNSAYANEIQKAIKALNFKDFILFNDNDIFRSFYLKDLLQPKKYIYYIRDFLLGVPYWKKHGKRLEPQHIAKADVVVANSVYLANYARKFNPNSHYVGQGCNVSIYSSDIQYNIPLDLRNVASPIVGYLGALASHRLDINLLEKIAQNKPEWNFVFVGPEDNNFKKSILHQMKNVFFLGNKAEIELPSYLSFFDVAINPQLINEITIGNYPRKIDEYLAMGKPSVARKTEAMAIFDEYVYLAEDSTDFIDKIEIALKEKNATLIERRIILALSHTWENNANEIYTAIGK